MAVPYVLRSSERLSKRRATNRSCAGRKDEDKKVPGKDASAKEKAQHRRAQVRRAQIQHRQRKADHIKQLELDVSRYRELIYLAEHEKSLIQQENDLIKATLEQASNNLAAWSQSQQQQNQQPQQPSSVLEAPQPALSIPEFQMQDMSSSFPGDIPLDFDVDCLTVELSMDDIMGTPTFKIANDSSSGSVTAHTTSPWPGVVDPQLSPGQEESAINFILA